MDRRREGLRAEPGGTSGDAVEVRSRWLVPERTLELDLVRGAERLPWSALLDGWRAEGELSERWSAALAAAPFAALFWETPPLTEERLSDPFSCVLVDAPTLARMRPEPGPFRAHLERRAPDGSTIACFQNLGGDALLLAPRARGAGEHAYTHLAAFLRGAPDAQRRELWRTVAERVEASLSGAPLWTSTSGLGVGWLHVRLDRFPKYYQHAPYRSPDARAS